MSYSKFVGLSALVFTIGLAVSPLFVSAQAATTGLLTVYVQVQNPQGASFVPGNFNVAVTGQNPAPATFAGSLQGTLVSLNPGSFAATIVGDTYGFSPSYSVGCNNTIAAGGSHLCVITLTRTGNYYQNPNQPQYTQTGPKLLCAPQTQTVAPGTRATFVAQNGVGGTYNWFANGRTYANMGPSFTVIVEAPGNSAVTVTNAAQTATCNISVLGNGGLYAGYYPSGPAYPLSAGPSTYYPTYTNPQNPVNVTYTATAYPRLPNAGFEPIQSAQVAFAIVFLLGAFIASYSYVRKAFAFAIR